MSVSLAVSIAENVLRKADFTEKLRTNGDKLEDIMALALPLAQASDEGTGLEDEGAEGAGPGAAFEGVA